MTLPSSSGWRQGRRPPSRRSMTVTRSAIFAAAYRLTSDRGTAEEVVQETFLILWNRAETFDPRTRVARRVAARDRAQPGDRPASGGRPPSEPHRPDLGGRHRRGRRRRRSSGWRRAGRSSPARARRPAPRTRSPPWGCATPSGGRSRPCRRMSGRSSSWPTRMSCHRPRSPLDSAGRSGRSRRGRAGRSSGCGAASVQEFGPAADAMMPVPAGEDR